MTAVDAALDGRPLDASQIDRTAELVGQDLARLLRIVSRLKQQTDMAAAHVLFVLEKGPARVGEIAAALGSDPSTVSRKVAALVDAGLVERRADPVDGRAHLLAATAAGERHCTESRRRRNEMVASVLTGWPEDARRQLAALIGRFADGMQEYDGRVPTRRPGGEN